MVLHGIAQLGPDASVNQSVLDHDDDVGLGGGPDKRTGSRDDPVRVHHRDGAALLLKGPSGLAGLSRHGAHAHQEDMRRAHRAPTLEQHVDDVEGIRLPRLPTLLVLQALVINHLLEAAHHRQRVGQSSLGVAHHRGGVVGGHGLPGAGPGREPAAPCPTCRCGWPRPCR